MDLLADFLHFGTSVFFVARRFRAVWSVGPEECSVKCEVWSVKEAVRSEKCEVWNVKCEVWSVKFKFGVRRAQCEVWSVKCEVRSVKEAVRSEKCEVRTVKCEVWSVKCEVWSVKFEVWSAKSAVWSVECGAWRLCFVSRWKKPLVEGRTRSGQVFLRTIGHLFLGNFRRRLARVLVENSCMAMLRMGTDHPCGYVLPTMEI